VLLDPCRNLSSLERSERTPLRARMFRAVEVDGFAGSRILRTLLRCEKRPSAFFRIAWNTA